MPLEPTRKPSPAFGSAVPPRARSQASGSRASSQTRRSINLAPSVSSAGRRAGLKPGPEPPPGEGSEQPLLPGMAESDSQGYEKSSLGPSDSTVKPNPSITATTSLSPLTELDPSEPSLQRSASAAGSDVSTQSTTLAGRVMRGQVEFPAQLRDSAIGRLLYEYLHDNNGASALHAEIKTFLNSRFDDFTIETVEVHHNAEISKQYSLKAAEQRWIMELTEKFESLLTKMAACDVNGGLPKRIDVNRLCIGVLRSAESVIQIHSALQELKHRFELGRNHVKRTLAFYVGDTQDLHTYASSTMSSTQEYAHRPEDVIRRLVRHSRGVGTLTEGALEQLRRGASLEEIIPEGGAYFRSYGSLGAGQEADDEYRVEHLLTPSTGEGGMRIRQASASSASRRPHVGFAEDLVEPHNRGVPEYRNILDGLADEQTDIVTGRPVGGQRQYNVAGTPHAQYTGSPYIPFRTADSISSARRLGGPTGIPLRPSQVPMGPHPFDNRETSTWANVPMGLPPGVGLAGGFGGGPPSDHSSQHGPGGPPRPPLPPPRGPPSFRPNNLPVVPSRRRGPDPSRAPGGGFPGGGPPGGGYPGGGYNAYPPRGVGPPTAQQKAEPYIDGKLRPEFLPSWNGDGDTAVDYFVRVHELAAMGGQMPEHLGRWLWTRFEIGSPVHKWYSALASKEKAYMQAHYTHFLAVVRDLWLGVDWQYQQRQNYAEMSFRQAGHSRESPDDFVRRRLILGRMIAMLPTDSSGYVDPAAEVIEASRAFPVSWRTKLEHLNIPTASILQQTVKRMSKELIYEYERERDQSSNTRGTMSLQELSTMLRRLRVDVPQARDSYPDRRQRAVAAHVVEEEGAEYEGEDNLVDPSSYVPEAFSNVRRTQRPPPKGGYPFAKRDDIVTKMRNKPPSPCKSCGSANHWDRECPHAKDWRTLKEAKSASAEETERPEEQAMIYDSVYEILLNEFTSSAYVSESVMPRKEANVATANGTRRYPRPTVEEVPDEEADGLDSPSVKVNCFKPRVIELTSKFSYVDAPSSTLR